MLSPGRSPVRLRPPSPPSVARTCGSTAMASSSTATAPAFAVLLRPMLATRFSGKNVCRAACALMLSSEKAASGLP
jgi:hypothetical protein